MAEKKVKGRPRKLDDAKKRRLLRLVMEGNRLHEAARSVGCCRRTVHRATQRDELFDWRLRLAKKVGRLQRRSASWLDAAPLSAATDRAHQGLREKDHDTTVVAGELLQTLHEDVRRLWQNEGSC